MHVVERFNNWIHPRFNLDSKLLGIFYGAAFAVVVGFLSLPIGRMLSVGHD